MEIEGKPYTLLQLLGRTLHIPTEEALIYLPERARKTLEIEVEEPLQMYCKKIAAITFYNNDDITILPIQWRKNDQKPILVTTPPYDSWLKRTPEQRDEREKRKKISPIIPYREPTKAKIGWG